MRRLYLGIHQLIYIEKKIGISLTKEHVEERGNVVTNYALITSRMGTLTTFILRETMELTYAGNVEIRCSATKIFIWEEVLT